MELAGSLYTYYTRTGTMPTDFEKNYNLIDDGEGKDDKLQPSTSAF